MFVVVLRTFFTKFLISSLSNYSSSAKKMADFKGKYTIQYLFCHIQQLQMKKKMMQIDERK